jgi:hypothetical protein
VHVNLLPAFNARAAVNVTLKKQLYTDLPQALNRFQRGLQALK